MAQNEDILEVCVDPGALCDLSAIVDHPADGVRNVSDRQGKLDLGNQTVVRYYSEDSAQ